MDNFTQNTPELPDKLYFKVGEVSEIADIPAYVLRFWETEFKKINPKRTASGQRLYRKSDVKLILEIKHLLYEKKFTIQGAKQHLKNASPENEAPAQAKSHFGLLKEIRRDLESLRKILE